jgi:hypothetical protein
MKRRPRISVIGSGHCDETTAAVAREVGRRIADAGCDLVCGGLGGVMHTVAKGAQNLGGRTIGILPGSSPDDANSAIDVPIATGLGQMRNALVVANGDVVIAVEGSSGTLSEVGFALKAGKAVIAIGAYADMAGVIAATSARQAVDLALRHIADDAH